MRAGALRHRIRIEQDTGTTKTAIGEDVKSWGRFAEVDAAIQPVRGNEAIALRVQGAEQVTKITTRYLPGVTSALRIVHGNVVYAIVEVINPNERNRMLEMLCTREAD